MNNGRQLRFSRRAFATGAMGLVAAGSFGLHAHADDPGAQPSPAATPELVLRISSSGGYGPPESYLWHTPNLSVYADGAVIQPAPVMLQYPPVAIIPLNTLTISPEAVEEIIGRAIAAKLNEPQDIVNSDLMDGVTTILSLTVDGTTIGSSIYGLEMTDQMPSDWDASIANRFVAIQQFADFVQSLAISLDPEDIVSGEAPYPVERLEVIAFKADPDQPLASGLPDVSAPPLSWPLDRSLAELGAVYEPWMATGLPSLRCSELDGEDAARVIAVAGQGSRVSPWTDQGKTYGLVLNPILPGDAGCQVPD